MAALNTHVKRQPRNDFGLAPHNSLCSEEFTYIEVEMDEPEAEIAGVIHDLTQTPPSTQRSTIDRYFTPDASFTHPFCRTGSFYWSETLNSRTLIHGIYRWYKIMSPRIDLHVESIAFDQSSLKLYATITQKFRIWIVPFYLAHVNLVTVLQLKHSKQSDKYYIQSQNDLYQVNEFLRFILFGGSSVLWLLQIIASLFCAMGALLLWPQTSVEEHWIREGWTGLAR